MFDCFMSSAPPDITVEKNWVHAAEGCDINLVCIVHGDVNSEVLLYVLYIEKIKLFNCFQHHYGLVLIMFFIFLLINLDVMVSKLVLVGRYRQTINAFKGRSLHIEY